MTALLRRFGLYLLTAWVAITVNFLLPRLMPGNPVKILIGRLTGQVTPQIVRSIELQFGVGLHQGLWAQYGHYWVQLFHGNLGESIYLSTPVSQVLEQSVPWTVGLIGICTVVSFALGTFIGTLLGWRRGTVFDAVLPISTFFQAVPYFFFGSILLLIFAAHLRWFPELGAYNTVNVSPGWHWAFIASVLRYGQLPAITVVLSSCAGWIMGMRNMTVTTIQDDFVLMAVAKGLPKRKVIGYAARNAVLPSIANFSLAIGLLVSGALLVELVFNYPGVGDLLLQAVQNEDYPLLQGIFLMVTFTVLAANFIADLVYIALDPRIRMEL